MKPRPEEQQRLHDQMQLYRAYLAKAKTMDLSAVQKMNLAQIGGWSLVSVISDYIVHQSCPFLLLLLLLLLLLPLCLPQGEIAWEGE